MEKSDSDELCLRLLDLTLEEKEERWVQNLLNSNEKLTQNTLKRLVKLFEKYLGFGREEM